MEEGAESSVAWFATKGSGTNEAQRMGTLLSRMPNVWELPFDKGAKGKSLITLLRLLRRNRPTLLVMEGTGWAGGAACLIARLCWRIRYVMSSGDAVGPFVRSLSVLWGFVFVIYERLLCRCAAGFIGWTPYLSGRALTFGCPRAMTAAGWPIGLDESYDATRERTVWRDKWGIAEDALVVGLVGSLAWNVRRQYCYGWDLVSAAARLRRKDLVVVVVGEGSGRAHLLRAAEGLRGTRVILPGAVPLDEVMPCLAAFDVASLPQSTDGVGSFRYTTKLSEYAAAGLPVITSQIPMAYDLGLDWMWRVKGDAPWKTAYIASLAELLEGITMKEVRQKRQAVPPSLKLFNRNAQIARVTAFLTDIMESARRN